MHLFWFLTCPTEVLSKSLQCGGKTSWTPAPARHGDHASRPISRPICVPQELPLIRALRDDPIDPYIFSSTNLYDTPLPCSGTILRTQAQTLLATKWASVHHIPGSCRHRACPRRKARSLSPIRALSRMVGIRDTHAFTSLCSGRTRTAVSTS